MKNKRKKRLELYGIILATILLLTSCVPKKPEEPLESEKETEEETFSEEDETPESETSSESVSSSEETSASVEVTEPDPHPVSEKTGDGKIICIDAGHQQHGISEKEPNGPGSSVMKAKLTTGTAGCVTGRPEYEVTLEVSLKLQAELQKRGYQIVMIRTTNDCPKSNAERAQIANESGAALFIRIHCNSVTDPNTTGIINYAPSPANPYMNANVVQESIRFAGLLADRMCAVTGAQNRGVLQDDTMTGINWCKIPVSIVEMGFMSNPDEDRKLSDPAYQTKLATGMANGIDAFFGK